jgi:hypothetical protein
VTGIHKTRTNGFLISPFLISVETSRALSFLTYFVEGCCLHFQLKDSLRSKPATFRMGFWGQINIWKVSVLIVVALVFIPRSKQAFNIFGHSYELDQKYGSFTEDMRQDMLVEVKKMFYFAYDGYMNYAFPLDELDPIHCVGRGPDHENPYVFFLIPSSVLRFSRYSRNLDSSFTSLGQTSILMMSLGTTASRL